MLVMVTVRLFQNPYTAFFISKDTFLLPNEECYKDLGINNNCMKSDNVEIDEETDTEMKVLKLRTSAYLLQPFVKECVKSKVYRHNVVSYLHELSRQVKDGLVLFKLYLKPPDQEIIDNAWNERVLRLVWTRVEIENAFSWLSTLGGAYSALGDYFEHCAEEAGRISVRQFKLSKLLGDEGLAARSRLYSALAYSQKGRLKLSRHIVRNVAAFGRQTKDRRLVRMCQGVWAKLKYLRALKKSSKLNNSGDCNG